MPADEKRVREILEKAADFLTDKRWTKGNLSLDARGMEVYHDSPDACRWCANGALRVIANDDEQDYGEAETFLLDVVTELGFDSVEDWNDAPGRTAAQVRKAMRKAAERQRKVRDE